MKLSVIVPSIRPGNLKRLYESIGQAFSGEYEMVVVSPYKLPRSMEGVKNLKFIEDWGTPIRAQQRGLLACEGEYVSWAADDGFFYPGTIDIAMKTLADKDYKTLVVGKYYEHSENPEMNRISYYYINTHQGSRSRFIANDCLMIMVGIVSKRLLFEIGGWDCTFEVCPMAYNDLSVRLYNYQCTFLFQEEIMFRCSHMPGKSGDHGPIHDAQTIFDQPMFRLLYSQKESQRRMFIDLNNWKNSPERWVRRFGVCEPKKVT